LVIIAVLALLQDRLFFEQKRLLIVEYLPMNKVNIFWFRRDLRLEDNAGLYHALKGPHPVLPLFIFDKDILDDLKNPKDRRVEFIHQALQGLKQQLEAFGSSLIVKYGKPNEAWRELLNEYEVAEVYTNHDYEPYARQRDGELEKLLSTKNIPFKTFKDQVIFDKEEVVKDDGKPFQIYTPYSRKWKAKLSDFYLKSYPADKYFGNLLKTAPLSFPALKDIGFESSGLSFPLSAIENDLITNYHKTRDYPGVEGTSRMSVHLRFGTVSIRKLVRQAMSLNDIYLNELIWREFYQCILWHYPHVVGKAFKPQYDRIQWRNNEQEFQRWCQGNTGVPIVDAGMRELNATGFMHNRVRMITASYLVKHLLIDWRWGEAYFAEKLLDYDLASNNGGWQWVAGTGVDAAPYFRIFNPDTQAKKFDGQLKYIRKWVPELDSLDYPQPMVDHKPARERTLKAYKTVLE
jgi:deoxyribodipyrimidine photo-lyase